MGKKTNRFYNLRNERISIKKQLTLLKMCVKVVLASKGLMSKCLN